MSPEVMQEPFTLTKGDSDVTSADGGTSASTYTDIWSYHVPTGIGLILLPGHTLAMYLYSDNSAEHLATALVKMVIQDAAQADTQHVIGPVLYAVLKEFVDRDKMFRLNIAKPIKVYEKQYLIIQVTGDGSNYVDVTGGTNESYFELATSRVRQPL